MRGNERILILTASYGDGHIQAARSLKLSFERHGVDQVHIMDLMKEAHPIINKITTTLYIKSMLSSRYGFDYYGWSYYVTKDANFNAGWGRYVNNLGQNKLKEIIDQLRPHALVSTFPFGAMPEVCVQIGIPSFTVVTDFSLHTRWIHPNINKYYVATEELKEQLRASTVSPHRIEVSGIPIRDDFEGPGSSDTSSMQGDLDRQRQTILIVAGAYGVLGSVDDMIDALKRINGSQLAVVCGRNGTLEQKLRLKYAHEPYVHIYGFVENIHQFMANSSCIVAKAGGLTLSEALALQVPLFIFKPFAGQEKENAAFLTRQGAAYVSHHIEELAFQIGQFLSEPNDIAEMKRKMQLLHKKSAADFIIRDILKSIKQPEVVINE